MDHGGSRGRRGYGRVWPGRQSGGFNLKSSYFLCYVFALIELVIETRDSEKGWVGELFCYQLSAAGKKMSMVLKDVLPSVPPLPKVIKSPPPPPSSW